MVTYLVEDWFSVKDEMSALWPTHWEEVATNRDKIKLNLDFDSYAQYARSGALHIVIARDQGKIIGYHASIIRPHLHYLNSLSAFTDVYYIDKEYRKGYVGIKLFRFVEESLRARGVQKMFTGTKLSLDMGKLFEFLGWTETERLYTKYIGD